MLELENISFSADSDSGEKEIIKNISLKIDESFVVITGPNGGGKSTLAKIIAGIVTPSSGRILLDGEDITGLSVTERARRGVSFAFQQPVHFKGLTRRANIFRRSVFARGIILTARSILPFRAASLKELK